MSNFERTQSDGVWINGYVVPRADFEDLDRKQFEAVNGDRGGAYSPSSAIRVGGSGLQVTGPTVVTGRGGPGSIVVSAGFLRLMGAEWPRLDAGHPGRERRIVCSTLPRLATPRFMWATRLDTPAGIQSVALGLDLGDPDKASPSPTCLVPLRVHDGARLASATFTFRVSKRSRRSPGPAVPPRFRVIAVSLDGDVIPLGASSLGADAAGYAGPAAPTTAAEWTLDGAPQAFVYECTTDHVINRGSFGYFAEIVEEVSADEALAVERKADVRCATTGNVALSGALNVDGIAVATGDRVLVRAQTSSAQNGIYVANTGGAWSRADDLNEPADFSPGFIVGVTAGIQNRNKFFQCLGPSRSGASTITLGTTSISFGSIADATPKGNVYTAVVLDFDGIADMRWQ